MTLFLQSPNRRYEVNDAYIMALSFILFFAVGRIIKSVIEKQKKKNAQTLPNPRGGTLGFEFADDSELALTILSCISDNESYLVKNQEIVKIIFGLVKGKIKNESLVLTPNLMRFLALKMINNDQTLILKIGNIVASSRNRTRLLMRVYGAAFVGLVGGIFATFPYAVLMVLLYFDVTENCVYRCEDYFEHLPKDEPIRVYAEKPTGLLTIAENDDARQLAIYIPSLSSNSEVSSTGEIKITTTHTKSRTKAKQVKFSDFRKVDPVLSKFKELEEPEVPQRICPIDPHHIIDIIE